MKIILGSASPRRKELLSLLGYDFEVAVKETAETIIEGTMAEIVEHIALEKAQALSDWAAIDRLIVCGDTMVVVDNEILGKPADAKAARKMLRMLSGKTHEVYSGVALRYQDNYLTFAQCTQVEFAKLSQAEISAYIASGEPFGKAGSYAIQGSGAKFVKSISGDYYNVVGLPLASLYERLKTFDRGCYTYMIRCADNSLYTGWTNDVEKRLAAHQSGAGAKYTKGKGAQELVYLERSLDKSQAMKAEYRLKRLTRPQKEAMINDNQSTLLRLDIAARNIIAKIPLEGIAANQLVDLDVLDRLEQSGAITIAAGWVRLNYQENIFASLLTAKLEQG